MGAVVFGVSVTVAERASAASFTFVVDSLEFGGPDVSAGDGTCATTEGTCTLRAALEESNALGRPAGEVHVTVADGLAGTIVPVGSNTAAASNRSRWMYPTATGTTAGRVSSQDVGGAFYHVTAPVSIDLDNRVFINDGDYDTSQGAAFYVDGPGVTFTDVSQIFGSGSSFVMGPRAAGVVIDGGETRTRASDAPDRFLTYTNGSQDITLRNYTVGGFKHHATGTAINQSRSALLWFDSALSTRFTGYTVDNVLFDYPTSGSCTATDGTGCATSLTDFRTRTGTNNSIQVTGFTFRNSTVRNMPGTKGVFAFMFGDGETQANNTSIINLGVTLTDLAITDNQFVDNHRYNHGAATLDPTKYGAFITLPYIPMHGQNVIARNDFVRAEPGRVSADRAHGLNPYAIYLQGNTAAANTTTRRNLAITDNYFDGFAGQSTIRLYQAGRVTVARNLFGPSTSSAERGANLASGEETGTGLVMLANANSSSNRKLNPWQPVEAKTVPSTGPTCDAEVTVRALTGTAQQTPKVPVRVDLYWTQDRTAEVLLGTYDYTSLTDQTIRLGLPTAGDERLRRIADQTGANVPVDPETGAVHGFVRVQTHSGAVGGLGDGDLESSQLSRVAPLTGTCAPTLTIDQSVDQADPTTSRDLHLTITSTLPLDVGSLTPDDIRLEVTATGSTTDADRINPQVISVAEVEGTSGTVLGAVARVDDSAVVTASIAAGAVTTPLGIGNQAPATSRDPQVTFVNPLVVDPPTFTLVTGEPHGKDYTLGIRPGAPVPTADLLFTAEVDGEGQHHGVLTSTNATVIAAGETTSAPITVTAAEGAAPAGTRTTVRHTVASEDPTFDALVVPPAVPVLFSTDPTISIVKRAFVEVQDTSSPEQVVATGTEVLTDARLTDRQAVCFVYTVTNTSADDWATVLTDLVVTDSDVRLGDGGRVGDVPVLEIGESAQVAACTSLLPVDTTTQPVAP